MREQWTVVWSGAMRRDYLFVEHYPVIEPTPIRRGRSPFIPDPVPVPDTPPSLHDWLCGTQCRAFDMPRRRLTTSLLSAPDRFTVHELAHASRVSVSGARKFLLQVIEAGTCRPAGTRPAGFTKVQLYERVPR